MSNAIRFCHYHSMFMLFWVSWEVNLRDSMLAIFYEGDPAMLIFLPHYLGCVYL
jgi:hypothetical protein